MKLESFFEKFDRFTEVPDSVEKLRSLVLQFAVTGKLLSQDDQDEPASVLLESLKAQRKALVGAKQIKARQSLRS